MKRTQCRIKVAGIVFGTREQIAAFDKAVRAALDNIDNKGGITKVDVEVPVRYKTAGKRKKKAEVVSTKTAELLPN